MEQYLENRILSFVRLLREAGVPVGTSEAIDSLMGLTCVDLTSREQVRTALFCLLIKSELDRLVFEAAFDVCFAPENVRAQDVARFLQAKDEVDAVAEELTFRETPLRLSDEEKAAYASLPEEERRRLREFITKTENGLYVGERHRALLERNVRGALRYQNGGVFMPLTTTGDDEWDAELYAVRRQKQEDALLFKDMANIGDDEIKDAVTLIRMLARRLATRIGRRYRAAAQARWVDMRRSQRNNLRYGGVPLKPAFRRRRVQKPSVMLICDVSGSMIRYSRFVILLLMGLSGALPRLRAFAFADRLIPLELRNFHPEDFGKISVAGAGTDLDHSLLEFSENYATLIHKRTVLVILSDTKTLQYRAAAERLRDLSGRVREILWLNPLEEKEWRQLPMTEAFRPYCRMMEAASLEKLAQALRDL